MNYGDVWHTSFRADQLLLCSEGGGRATRNTRQDSPLFLTPIASKLINHPLRQ